MHEVWGSDPAAGRSKRILLEAIVCSVEDGLAAAAHGADRFELCAAMPLGGLTPSLGTLISLRRETPVPVMFMLRPREAGMCYSPGDLRAMTLDAELALANGAQGLVTGLLTPSGELDVVGLKSLMDSVDPGRSVDWVCHRAFDVTLDPDEALEQLIDLGFKRVLTSGRAARAPEGLGEIRRTRERAAGRIEVLPGGGIRLDEVERVLRETGVDQIHLGFQGWRVDPSTRANPKVSFGVGTPPSDESFRVLEPDAVRRVHQTLSEYRAG